MAICSVCIPSDVEKDFLLFFFLTIVTCQTTVCEEHSLPECELFSLCIALEPCRTFLKLCRWPFWLTKPRLKLWPAPLRVWLDLYLCQSQEVNNSLLKKGKLSSKAGKRIVAEKFKGMVHSKFLNSLLLLAFMSCEIFLIFVWTSFKMRPSVKQAILRLCLLCPQ